MYLFHIGRNIGRPRTRRLPGAHRPQWSRPLFRGSLPGAPADAGPNLEQHSGKPYPPNPHPQVSHSPGGLQRRCVREAAPCPPGSIFPPQPAARNRNSERKGVPHEYPIFNAYLPGSRMYFSPGAAFPSRYRRPEQHRASPPLFVRQVRHSAF